MYISASNTSLHFSSVMTDGLKWFIYTFTIILSSLDMFAVVQHLNHQTVEAVLVKTGAAIVSVSVFNLVSHNNRKQGKAR